MQLSDITRGWRIRNEDWVKRVIQDLALFGQKLQEDGRDLGLIAFLSEDIYKAPRDDFMENLFRTIYQIADKTRNDDLGRLKMCRGLVIDNMVEFAKYHTLFRFDPDQIDEVSNIPDYNMEYLTASSLSQLKHPCLRGLAINTESLLRNIFQDQYQQSGNEAKCIEMLQLWYFQSHFAMFAGIVSCKNLGDDVEWFPYLTEALCAHTETQYRLKLNLELPPIDRVQSNDKEVHCLVENLRNGYKNPFDGVELQDHSLGWVESNDLGDEEKEDNEEKVTNDTDVPSDSNKREEEINENVAPTITNDFDRNIEYNDENQIINVKYCNYCGKPLSESSCLCEFCGKPFSNFGYIILLINPRISGLIRIGYDPINPTQCVDRLSLEDGSPGRYEVVSFRAVGNANKVLLKVKDELTPYQYNADFFEIELEAAINLFDETTRPHIIDTGYVDQSEEENLKKTIFNLEKRIEELETNNDELKEKERKYLAEIESFQLNEKRFNEEKVNENRSDSNQNEHNTLYQIARNLEIDNFIGGEILTRKLLADLIMENYEEWSRYKESFKSIPLTSSDIESREKVLEFLNTLILDYNNQREKSNSSNANNIRAEKKESNLFTSLFLLVFLAILAIGLLDWFVFETGYHNPLSLIQVGITGLLVTSAYRTMERRIASKKKSDGWIYEMTASLILFFYVMYLTYTHPIFLKENSAFLFVALFGGIAYIIRSILLFKDRNS